MLDRKTVLKIAEQYACEVAKILNPSLIVLFGSYAKGVAKLNSDIDIAVIFDSFTDDYIETSKQLYKIRRNISVDIEPVILDLVNDKSGFVAEVLRTGVIVYQA